MGEDITTPDNKEEWVVEDGKIVDERTMGDALFAALLVVEIDHPEIERVIATDDGGARIVFVDGAEYRVSLKMVVDHS